MVDNRRPTDARRDASVTRHGGIGKEGDPDHAEGRSSVADGGRPSLDRVFEGLCREYDRYVLYHLLENESAEFDELVDSIAAVETGEPAATAPDEVRSWIETELYHVRLPKLARLGIIEYDERGGSVRFRNLSPHLEAILHLARDVEER